MFNKMNIYRRFLLLLLSVGLLSFLALSIVSLWSLYDVEQKAVGNGRAMGNVAGSSMEKMTLYFAQQRLMSIACDRAYRLNHELSCAKEDVENVASDMGRILTNPDRYRPRRLKNAQTGSIMAGEACIYYTPEIRSQAAQNSLFAEIGLASNIADTLENTASFYMGEKGFFSIASEHGYYITVNTLFDEQKVVEFSPDFLARYEPKEAPWYKNVMRMKETVISDVFLDDNTHIPFISVSAPYYAQNEIAGVANISINVVSLQKIVDDESMGASGINFAVNSKGDVVFSSDEEGLLSTKDGGQDLRQVPETALAAAVTNMVEGKSDVVGVSINAEDYYLAYAPIPCAGWSFGTVVKAEEVIAPTKVALANIETETNNFVTATDSFFRDNLKKTGILLVVILTALTLFSRMEAKRFSQPILALTDGIRDIAKGNLDKKLDIKTGDEIEKLSDSVNNMTAELKKHIANLAKATAEKQSIATELSFARSIQEGLLPKIFPQESGDDSFALFATMEAAKEVGGDFYDFYKLDKDHIAVTIADVSGKGIGAALFMAITKTILKNCALSFNYTNLGDMVSHVNNLLKEDNTQRMFVTAFMGILDLKTGRFCYVNCGHNPPLVYRAEKNNFAYLDVARNFVLGGRKGLKFEEQNIMFAPGDGLFLYTDGVTEAFNEAEELYGEERLLETLNRVASPKASPEEILTAVRTSLATYVGAAEQSDDITMLELKFLG